MSRRHPDRVVGTPWERAIRADDRKADARTPLDEIGLMLVIKRQRADAAAQAARYSDITRRWPNTRA